MRWAKAVRMRRIRAVHSSPPTADRTGPARRNIGGGLGRLRGRGRRPTAGRDISQAAAARSEIRQGPVPSDIRRYRIGDTNNEPLNSGR
jgi:hypothetical protein